MSFCRYGDCKVLLNHFLSRKLKIQPNLYAQYCKQEFSKEALCRSDQDVLGVMFLYSNQGNHVNCI